MSYRDDTRCPFIGMPRPRSRRHSASSSCSSVSLNSSQSGDEDDMEVPAIFTTRLIENFEANRGFRQMAAFPMLDIDLEEDRSSVHDDLSDEDMTREDASSNVDWDVVDDLTEDADWEVVGSDVERVGEELAFDEDDMVHLTRDLDWDNAPFDYDAVVDRPRHRGYEWEAQSLSHLAVPWLLIANARRRRPVVHAAARARRIVRRARTAQTNFVYRARTAQTDLVDRARSIGRTTQAAIGVAMATQGLLPGPATEALNNQLVRIRQMWPHIRRSVGREWLGDIGALLRDGMMTLPPMATQHAILRRYR